MFKWYKVVSLGSVDMILDMCLGISGHLRINLHRPLQNPGGGGVEWERCGAACTARGIPD